MSSKKYICRRKYNFPSIWKIFDFEKPVGVKKYEIKFK